jgi:hypothetical protein
LITVVTCTEGEVEGENYDRKFEQASAIVGFTAVAGSETECVSVKGSLCDCLSKQGSGVRCEQIERYVDKWDIEREEWEWVK